MAKHAGRFIRVENGDVPECLLKQFKGKDEYLDKCAGCGHYRMITAQYSCFTGTVGDSDKLAAYTDANGENLRYEAQQCERIYDISKAKFKCACGKEFAYRHNHVKHSFRCFCPSCEKNRYDCKCNIEGEK